MRCGPGWLRQLSGASFSYLRGRRVRWDLLRPRPCLTRGPHPPPAQPNGPACLNHSGMRRAGRGVTVTAACGACPAPAVGKRRRVPRRVPGLWAGGRVNHASSGNKHNCSSPSFLGEPGALADGPRTGKLPHWSQGKARARDPAATPELRGSRRLGLGPPGRGSRGLGQVRAGAGWAGGRGAAVSPRSPRGPVAVHVSL